MPEPISLQFDPSREKEVAYRRHWCERPESSLCHRRANSNNRGDPTLLINFPDLLLNPADAEKLSQEQMGEPEDVLNLSYYPARQGLTANKIADFRLSPPWQRRPRFPDHAF
ncbi:MAG TPA: hypothetical protein VGQ99_20135 [Tepidisphaeraceae bacterium]|jgi:hypothetical protein|nr:hypothetical protein [Tepidisphaeraceae bacterium]